MEKQNAIFSVFDKKGIKNLALRLNDLNWNALASGGTGKAISETNVPVTDVADFVGGEEILGHRVVTISREIGAALQATRSKKDVQTMREQGLEYIDLVCVDLYHLRDAINKGLDPLEILENIDVGGTLLLHGGAKENRIMISDPNDYPIFLKWFEDGMPDKQAFIDRYCGKADAVVADHIILAADFHSRGFYKGAVWEKAFDCCYGQNRYQQSALYRDLSCDDPLAVHNFISIDMDGMNPSHINICDFDEVLRAIVKVAATFDENEGFMIPKIALGAKHGIICGGSVGGGLETVIKDMLVGSPEALFGGEIITNFTLEEEHAELLKKYFFRGNRMWDMIIVPDITPEAVDFLKRKKTGKCRIFKNPALHGINKTRLEKVPLIRPVRGGAVISSGPTFILNLEDKRIEKMGAFTQEQERALLLASAIGASSPGNVITLAKEGMIIGNGTSQPSRKLSCKVALMQAEEADHSVEGSTGFSNSFFSDRDAVQCLLRAGVEAIFATSGGQKYEEIKDVFAREGVSFWTIPDADGRVFCRH